MTFCVICDTVQLYEMQENTLQPALNVWQQGSNKISTDTYRMCKGGCMAEMKKAVVDKAAEKNVATKTETAAPAEVKAVVKTETAKAEETATVVKKKPGRKPGSKNAVKKAPAVKKAEKKEAVKKEVKNSITLELNGYSYTEESLVQSAKDVWVYDLGRDVEDFKSVELYVKPEDKAVYYVINGEVKGSYAL